MAEVVRRLLLRLWGALWYGLTIPDRVMHLATLAGCVVLALWPVTAPRGVVMAWAAVLLGLWVWGRLILKPWRLRD